MEFIYIVRWLLYVATFFAVAPIAYILAPIVAVYSVIKKDDAPRMFYYLLTPDNPLDGDKSHWVRWKGTGFMQTVIRRTAWQWRNILYNFRYDCLGVDVCPAQARWQGTQVVNGELSKQGWQLAVDDKTSTFSFFLYYKYPFGKFGIRMYMGWKYKNRQRDIAVGRKMLSFMVNPFW